MTTVLQTAHAPLQGGSLERCVAHAPLGLQQRYMACYAIQKLEFSCKISRRQLKYVYESLFQSRSAGLKSDFIVSGSPKHKRCR